MKSIRDINLVIGVPRGGGEGIEFISNAEIDEITAQNTSDSDDTDDIENSDE